MPLLKYTELPGWRRDNPSILTGYRPLTPSVTSCFQSLTFWHNETVNVYSHLFGSFYSIYVLIYDAPKNEYDTGWLSYVFLLGATTCFVCSAAFHTSLSHSQRAAQLMNTIDYLAILVLGTTNYLPTIHFAFFCDPLLRVFYISLALLAGTTGICLILSPQYATPAYRRMRTLTFIGLGVPYVLPFVHSLLRYGAHQTKLSTSATYLFYEALFYISGSLLYAERFPERLYPGTFDYIGASHQIFHTLSVFAVITHWIATKDAAAYRFGVLGGRC